MINKENILNKTHYGLHIYSHILRLYYPDAVVLRLLGRDCGTSCNPFNTNKKTLHIFITKANPTNAKSAELACHEDSTNALPAGNAFDFAELHYKQQGEELLHTLNKELNLRIGKKSYHIPNPTGFRNNQRQNSYPNRNTMPKTVTPHIPNTPMFSFFKAPVSNTTPYSETTLRKVYNAITGNYYKERTEHLRKITAPKQARHDKATNFDYCTFSGIFTTRNDKALLKHSGLLCIDFDHLPNLDETKIRLLTDAYFDTQLLFRSPSGDGLKWIIPIDTATTLHGDYFTAVTNYIQQTYGITVDKSGRDISRACFLPYDPQAFINPIYLK